jgi:hypothetical protein
MNLLLLVLSSIVIGEECTMSLDDVLSWKTDCSNYKSVAEGSWESCKDACLENSDCIGVQTDNPWDHCESIMNANVEECDEGDFTFYPKNCAAGKQKTISSYLCRIVCMAQLEHFNSIFEGS